LVWKSCCYWGFKCKRRSFALGITSFKKFTKPTDEYHQV
jgi:hypothetical protein